MLSVYPFFIVENHVKFQ